MKKVLIITYYWPPSGGSGVQRWMYFCEYLSQFGYEPHVLTVSEKSATYKNYDESFLERVKDVKTYKADSFELLKLYSFVTTGDSRKGIPTGTIQGKKKSVVKKIATYVRGNFFIPDARVGWVSKATKKALEVINEQNIELVITTGPPHSSHLIGLNIKEKCNVKWVADLRDPWTDIFYNKDLMQSKRAVSKNTQLEKTVLEKADKVLTIGFKLKELLQSKLTGARDKFHHIYNGYDSFLMEEIQVEKTDKFEITFIGLLTNNQPYKSFVSAVKDFSKNIPDEEIVIVLAGNIQQEIIDCFKEKLPGLTFDIRSYIPHKVAIGLMKKSDLLVNVLSTMKQSEILISGKQMEYIATGNPILCFGNIEGESAILLKEISNAQVCEENQIEIAAKFISEVYNKWKMNEPFISDSNNSNILDKSRFETTRQLAKFLDTI